MTAAVDIRFTAVRFDNYKALKAYSVTLNHFNVLVGPNNAGKSTVLGAFRILAEGIRKARSKRPELVRVDKTTQFAIKVNLEGLPISTENIFHNYDDSEPARVTFRFSNSSELELYFPEVGACFLLCRTSGRPVRSPSDFKREFPVTVGFVPVLGPVEHEEQLFQQEAAKRALLTHTASRNFRNIWYHFRDNFDVFRDLVRTTWPGMDIEPPTVERTQNNKPILTMFCPEQRYPREIYWAGFGFQVWCQMLTFLLRSASDSLLIIDEPDIYLHSDLQRQLLGILENLGPDVMLATHSTEIIGEAEPASLLVINKKYGAAKRIKNPGQIDSVLKALGSNLNPTLTQLAKTRRALFLEGKDFQIIGSFAARFKYSQLATRSDFAIVPLDGFNPNKIESIAQGIKITLDAEIAKAVVLDRDYRSMDEIGALEKELQRTCQMVHIHHRKELENYLLIPNALTAAVERRCAERQKRTGERRNCEDNMSELLTEITDARKREIESQFVTRYADSIKARDSRIDRATANLEAMAAFDEEWNDLDSRLKVVPGKQILSDLNTFLQEKYSITLTAPVIIGGMIERDVPKELLDLLRNLDAFCRLLV